MQETIIQRLFNSFSELDQAIQSAKKTLSKKASIPKEVIERLSSYDGILEKQRNLADSLCKYIENSEWDEVNRHVSLINGLSGLIRDDAKAILSSLSEDQTTENEIISDQLVC